MKVSYTFRSTCIVEPRGDFGLEGYSLGGTYWTQLIRGETTTYVRLFPTARGRPTENTRSYYETCSLKIYSRYFKATSRRPIGERE